MTCSTFHPEDTWTGMDKDQGFGSGTDPVGCAVHCLPCLLYAHYHAGVTDSGRRWLNWTRRLPSRDAHGNLTPTLSITPKLVPSNEYNVQRAPCWKNPTSDGAAYGKECQRSFCNCDSQHDKNYDDTWVEGMRICRDVDEGLLRTVQLPDDYFFYDHDLPNEASLMMDCRTEQPPETGVLTQEFETGRESAYQLFSARSMSCLFGFNAILYGRTVEDSPCYPWAGGWQYWNNETRSRWKRWFITQISPRLARPPGKHPEGLTAIDASIDVKNAALAFVEADHGGFKSVMHFDRVEMSAEAFDSPNEHMTKWYQFFHPDDRANPPDPPPPGYDPTYPPVFTHDVQARTKWGRQPIRVEMTIVGRPGHDSMIMLDAVLGYVKHRTNSIFSEPGLHESQIWPSMRVRILLQFAVRAYPVKGVEYVAKRPHTDGTYETVPIEIVNPVSDLSQDFPVMDPPLDEIEFFLPDAEGNERPFEPPPEAEWYGSRQPLSSGQGEWEQQLTPYAQEVLGDVGVTTEVACRAVAECFTEAHAIEVPGAPTEHSETNKIQRYMGSVIFHITDYGG